MFFKLYVAYFYLFGLFVLVICTFFFLLRAQPKKITVLATSSHPGTTVNKLTIHKPTFFGILRNDNVNLKYVTLNMPVCLYFLVPFPLLPIHCNTENKTHISHVIFNSLHFHFVQNVKTTNC